MAKITILSLDYDGCSDILFDDVVTTQSIKSESTLRHLRSLFEELLNRITADSSIVELYVGSDRQDNQLDNLGNSVNRNGLCFKNFEKLCNEKNWRFKKLLMADIANLLPCGHSMENSGVKITNDFVKINNWSSKSKSVILNHQLQDVIKNHPGDEINFYFMDDHDYNIRSVVEYFGKSRNLIPDNIDFYLVEHNWYHACPVIIEHGNIRDINSSQFLRTNSLFSGNTGNDYHNSVFDEIHDIGFCSIQ